QPTVLVDVEPARERRHEDERRAPLDREGRDSGRASPRESRSTALVRAHPPSPSSPRGIGRPASASRMPRILSATPASSPLRRRRRYWNGSDASTATAKRRRSLGLPCRRAKRTELRATKYCFRLT